MNIEELKEELQIRIEQYEKAKRDKKSYVPIGLVINELKEQIESLETLKVDNENVKSDENKQTSLNIKGDNNINNNSNYIRNMALAPEKVIDIVSKIFRDDYAGCPIILNSIIDKLEILKLSIGHEDNKALLLSLIKAKMIAKAREAVECSDSMDSIIENIKEKCKGKPSWQVAATLEGLKIRDQDKYKIDLIALTESLKQAYIGEGVGAVTATQYVVQAAVKNIKQNNPSNVVLQAALAMEFKDVDQVVHKYQSLKNEREAQVLAFRGTGRGQMRGNFRGGFGGNYQNNGSFQNNRGSYGNMGRGQNNNNYNNRGFRANNYNSNYNRNGYSRGYNPNNSYNNNNNNNINMRYEARGNNNNNENNTRRVRNVVEEHSDPEN
jgi:hypothetical protein